MLSTSDVTALVALVISLIALVVTATQLSAQLFSTAEGTRKCSKSVLGPWSNSRKPDTRTRWNWRWSECRYETLYVAPDISLSSSFTWYPPSESTSTKALGPDLKDTVKNTLDHLAQSVKRTRPKLLSDAILGADDDLDDLLFRCEYQKRGTDMVGWIGFLTHLRVLLVEDEVIDRRKWTRTITKRKAGPRTVRTSQVSWPKIKYIQHSWDFMPADCPKPLASSTVGDIAVLVRRTGMVWKEFKPGEGRMTAEGGPHVISSMEQRGLGIVLQYRCLDDTLNYNVNWVRKEREEREAKQEKKDTTIQANSQEARECGDPRKKLSEVKPPESLQIKDEETGAGNGGDGIHDQRRENIAAKNGIQERLRRFLCCWRSEEDGEKEEEEEEEYEEDYGVMDDMLTLWDPIRSLNLSQDKMMFGWIPSDPALNIPDFPHATLEECSNVLVDLIGDPGLRDFVGKFGRDGFNDLLYLAPEALHQRGRGRYRLQNRGHSDSVFYKSVWIMAEILKKYSDGEKFTGQTFWQTDVGIDRMKDFSQKFESLTLGKLDLDTIHTYHEETTEYFRKLEEEHHLQFHKVLAVHFTAVTEASTRGREQWKVPADWYETNEELRTKHATEYWQQWELTDRWRTLDLYFSYLSDYGDFMINYDLNTLVPFWGRDKQKISFFQFFVLEEAWLMLMLRGFLYRELHDFSNEFVEEEYLDRKYYKSKIPVWLG